MGWIKNAREGNCGGIGNTKVKQINILLNI